MTSPLLAEPGAVEADGPDSGVAAHYGDPYAEQRALGQAWGVVDRSHRGVVQITGPDRLSWLHSLTTQDLERLAPGDSAEALILSPQGHVEHHLTLTDDGTAVWAHVEPGTAGALLDFLTSMRFMLRVEPRDVTGDYAVLTVAGPAQPDQPAGTAAAEITTGGGTDLIVPRAAVTACDRGAAAAARPWPACGRTRPCASRRAGPGSGWTPTTGRSRTRSAGSTPPCT